MGREEKCSRIGTGIKIPKCCIKYDADILRNLCKATRFDYETHYCTFNLLCLFDKGWLARL